MRIQVISKNLGLVLVVNALFMLISAGVAALNGFDTGFSPLILSSIITATVGSFPYIFVKEAYVVNAKEGYVIVGGAWVLSCLFGMLPYVLWGGEFTLVNAWFESVSGYSTTGATILNRVEALPRSLLFWRAVTHWLGGIGVVMFMLLMLPEAGTLRFRLSKMELSNYYRDQFKFRAYDTIRSVAVVYFSLTILVTLLLWLCGMNLFEAVTHAFTTTACGGFSSRDGSMMAFNNPLMELVIALGMLVSALHLGLIYLAFTGKPGVLFKNPVTRYYLLCVLVAGLLISGNLWISGHFSNPLQALRHGFFQTVAMSTTTGLVTADSNVWPLFSIFLINLLSIQCACAGSTSGGMKADRVRICIAAVRAYVTRQAHPKSVVPVRIQDRFVENELVESVLIYIVLYAFILLIGVLFFVSQGLDLANAFTVSLSNVGNVGVAFGEVGSATGSCNALTPLAKVFSTLQMILGRVEIIPFLMLFRVFTKR